MKRSAHYILLAVTVLLTVVCGILMLHVNVNADMTKYLPDNSQMKRGLEIVTSEFGSSAQMSGADVHVMFEGVRPPEVPGIATLLEAYPDVHSVTYRYSTDSAYTVFDLDVPKSVDQKSLGKQISNRFGGNCVVETSQDGATPPVSVMIIAAVLIALVLFLMAQSWFEPVVVLISTGMAIVLNMGTNALLPSVSITTNFIGSILQAVLSLDYCIVLLNRYRQEQDEYTDRRTAILAANRALRKAAPSILSSALTTIVGLLMLCFMRLKIGADMGIVLAKGVACSLLCTFTVMPSLMLLFRRTINHSQKRVFVPPTDGMARFATSHKVTMAIFAVVLFFASWFLSRRTTIFFSAQAESRIEKVFPSPNPFVLVYDTHDEDSVLMFVDTLMAQPGIQTIISYPTLMSQRLTPADMTSHIRTLTTTFADMMPAGAASMPPEAMDMLSPDIIRLVYFMRTYPDTVIRLEFPDLVRFMHDDCARNPLFAGYIDDEMREQLDMLMSMMNRPEEEAAPVAETSGPSRSKTPSPASRDTSSKPAATRDTTTGTPAVPVARDSAAEPPLTDALTSPDMAALPASEPLPVPAISEPERIALVPFIETLNTTHTSPVTIEMRKLTDTMALRLPMAVNEMAAFIGSTPIQTRLVYGYAPGKVKQLTPLQYVHLLTDDLFQRKGLAGMISDEQRTMLGQRARLMDLANANASLTPAEMNTMLHAFGIDEFTDSQLLALSQANQPETESASAGQSAAPATPSPIITDSIASMLRTISALQDSLARSRMAREEKEKAGVLVKSSSEQPVVAASHKPSREDQQAELFTELMFGEQAYTSAQMAKHLAQLMQLSGVKSAPVTPSQMSLLYTYYAAAHSACDTMRMGLDALLAYACDTLVYDPRLEEFVPDSVRTQAGSIHAQIKSGIGQLRQPDHSLLVLLTTLPPESAETYAFVDTLTALADAHLPGEHYYVGESVMYAEMRGGFDHEMNVVTLLTILAIFLIVAVTFRSLVVPTILVVTVMTAFYVNVVVAGLVSGRMLYLAYLIVQAILMGATIDYGILFANYYREFRRTMTQYDAAAAAYRGSIRTILTSGLIMVLGPGVMALLIDDLMISNIVGCLAVGAFMAIVLILTVVPAVLVALDKWVVYGKKNRYSAPPEDIDCPVEE